MTKYDHGSHMRAVILAAKSIREGARIYSSADA